MTISQADGLFFAAWMSFLPRLTGLTILILIPPEILLSMRHRERTSGINTISFLWIFSISVSFSFVLIILALLQKVITIFLAIHCSLLAVMKMQMQIMIVGD